MKKLLGAFNYNGEKFIFQENGTIAVVSGENYVKPKNYDLINNRNTIIGNQKITGEGVFNFRYGPVTGGVAEAGIYNIFTNGEKILGVQIDVSYKRRYIEDKLKGKSIEDGLKLANAVCGNFAFSHSLAYCKTIEKILKINLPEVIKYYRIIGLELERIYNHFYVIAELAKGAAQKVYTSHMQYLFEESLRVNKIFSGSRHLIGFNKIGGVSRYLNKEEIVKIIDKLSELEERFKYLYEKSLESGNYLDRLHNTGIITTEKALEIGLTGPSLRASNFREDLREFDNDYNLTNIPVKEEGDALARMEVRAEEIFISINIIKEKLQKIKDFNDSEKNEYKIKNGEEVAAVESPSGTICYFIAIKNGLIDYCYIVTPSTFGFKAIADSLVGQIFTDFVFTVESFGVNFADAAR